jgi:hypothetical protein
MSPCLARQQINQLVHTISRQINLQQVVTGHCHQQRPRPRLRSQCCAADGIDHIRVSGNQSALVSAPHRIPHRINSDLEDFQLSLFRRGTLPNRRTQGWKLKVKKQAETLMELDVKTFM